MNLPFEGDTFIKGELIKLKDRFSLKYCIETGSQYGYTTKALAEIFQFVDTIEADKECFSKSLETLNDIKTVVTIFGKSEQILRWWDKFEDTLFYLDAHANGQCPLKEELEIIAATEPKNICIAIHDFKNPQHPEFGYDTYDYELCFEEIEPYLKMIYKDGFEYHYNNEANGAMRGIGYFYPKTSN